MEPRTRFGGIVEVVIDTPRGSFVKRRDDGSLDFVSLVPSPYNYGSVPGTLAGDGDRLDAIVLGPRLARGSRVRLPVRAVVRFVDGGTEDLKLICSPHRLRRRERALVELFFRIYVPFKRAVQLLRRGRGAIRFDGVELLDEGDSERA
ncbi:MAG: inorganic diphosphatase [Myxococcales bacterium]|jgi:inorganic pyrophosphatase